MTQNPILPRSPLSFSLAVPTRKKRRPRCRAFLDFRGMRRECGPPLARNLARSRAWNCCRDIRGRDNDNGQRSCHFSRACDPNPKSLTRLGDFESAV